MMLTEWGKQLDKSCPLSEYPRPQFVRDSYLSLNGMWQCAFTRDSTVPVQMDTAICVPFSPETPLSGVERTLKPGEYLHYRRTFALPENFNRGRVFLHFGAPWCGWCHRLENWMAKPEVAAILAKIPEENQ